MVSPMTDLLRKDEVWEWTPEREAAFEAVKTALVSAPVLHAPNYDLPFEVVCDASNFGIGAVLLQEGNPVAYESRKLTDAETRYHTTDREMLAVFNALTKWRCHLLGSTFTVVTDHNPLVTFDVKATKKFSPRQARWLLFLQTFKFSWRYRPGASNVADPLSRRPDIMATLTRLRARKASTPVLPAEPAASVGGQPLRRGRKRKPSDPLANPAGAVVFPDEEGEVGYTEAEQTAAVELHERIKTGYTTDAWFAEKSHTDPLMKKDGLWWHEDQVVVPDVDGLRSFVLHEFHDSPYSGHPGMNRTEKAVARFYWWTKMKECIRDYVRSCADCQRDKAGNQLKAGLLRPLDILARRWQTVTMDLITSLPETKWGHDAIIVFVDKLSKMVHLVAAKTAVSAKEMAWIFMNTVYKHHGQPEEIVCDRDPGSLAPSGGRCSIRWAPR